MKQMNVKKRRESLMIVAALSSSVWNEPSTPIFNLYKQACQRVNFLTICRSIVGGFQTYDQWQVAIS
jgi:hypothetical protein